MFADAIPSQFRYFLLSLIDRCLLQDDAGDEFNGIQILRGGCQGARGGGGGGLKPNQTRETKLNGTQKKNGKPTHRGRSVAEAVL
jgi:hypothetical protein